MSHSRPHIPKNSSRWKPNPDPSSIVVPSLDTESSTIDQIEQIEQLITIKLQNIDENFSKIHNVLANKLLPAVKRYAVGTEPVREAAKFWTSFYEQAAQIRIPTYEDYSTVNESQSDREEVDSSSQGHASQASEEADQTAPASHHQHQGVYERSVANSENSFLPGQDAFSSTPATSRHAPTTQDSSASQDSDDPSWTRSLESPLMRLNREISQFSIQGDADESILPSSSKGFNSQRPELSNLSFDSPQKDSSTMSRTDKGKGKEASQPLLRNVLRHNLYSGPDITGDGHSKSDSPSKFRGKPKTPIINKSLNPYLPPEASPADWSGVVDLRDPSVLTPQRHRPGKFKFASKATTPHGANDDDDDDSFDGLPPGMSPPVLMSPARPPRSSAELGLLKVGQTPTREASARIKRDLLRDTQYRNNAPGTAETRRMYDFPHSGFESSMSTVPTPPSLSRYSRPGEYNYSTSRSITKDSSLESMIRHIRNDIQPVPTASGLATTPGLRLRPRTHAAQPPSVEPTPQNQYQPHVHQNPPSEPATPAYNAHMHQQDMDSDSDSLDEINNTAHPSAAFLMASQGHQYDDDSFGSSNHSSDSLTDEDVGAGGLIPVHPFAANVVEDDGFDDDDDSFNDGFEPGAGRGDFVEETVFGVAPAERERMSLARESQGYGDGLRMMGEELLQDTIGIGAAIAANGGVEESPTPASWR
ncbi:hypothetical protein B0H34DRAFT_645410 [Crassisporium funariophilum]|nr:hypothetical protein B0H34DRAFT_645410 [Crassisporium funariophilum]